MHVVALWAPIVVAVVVVVLLVNVGHAGHVDGPLAVLVSGQPI